MKNLTRKIVVFFTAIFLSISVGSVSFADGHGKKILFSIKGPGSGNPFWASVTKGAEEEAKKLGVKLILIAPPQEGDVQAQINQVEDQLAKGVDALALAPGDPNAFAPIVAPSQVPWGKKAFTHYLGETETLWKSYDAIELIKNAEVHLPILVDQGTADDFLEEQLRPKLISDICLEQEYPLTLNLREGYDHSYYFIASFIEKHIEFHSKFLAK